MNEIKAILVVSNVDCECAILEWALKTKIHAVAAQQASMRAQLAIGGRSYNLDVK